MTTAGATTPLWTRGFARLVAVRLVSQGGDGAFAAGVAFLVLLSPDAQRTPAAYTGALALLLLPFCLVGPFVACVLDRWRRQRVLVVGQLVRVVLALGVAVVALAGSTSGWAYVLVLVVLGVNRLLLAALSAVVPHLVARERLVDANAVAPTLGTVATGTGAAVGGVVAATTQAAVAVLVAVVLWAAASALATRWGSAALGPDEGARPPSLADAARDLGAALHHLVCRRAAGVALARFGAFRLVLGAWTLAALVALGPDGADTAVVAVATAAGFGLGAAGTPLASRLVPTGVWVLVTVVTAGLVAAVAPLLTAPWSWALAGLGLGLLAQSLKIWTDTLVQRHVGEPFLGRAFTVYDLVYNAAFVAGALLWLPLA